MQLRGPLKGLTLCPMKNLILLAFTLFSLNAFAQVDFQGKVEKVVIGPMEHESDPARDLCVTYILEGARRRVLIEDITDCEWARAFLDRIGDEVEFSALYADELPEGFRPELQALLPDATYFLSLPE